MKNKYQRLSKEDKKIVIDEYKKESDINKNIYTKLTRASILFIICMVYVTVATIILLIRKDYIIWEIITYGGTLIISLCLLLYVNDYKKTILNKFVIDNKSKFSKKIKDFEKK